MMKGSVMGHRIVEIAMNAQALRLIFRVARSLKKALKIIAKVMVATVKYVVVIDLKKKG